MVEPITLRGFRKIEDIRFHLQSINIAIAFRSLPKLFKHNYRLRYFKNERVRKISDIKHPSIKAVFKKYLKKNISAEVVHSSDIPGLSGLSSSSAFTVSLIKLLSKFNKLEFSKKELLKIRFILKEKY